MRRLPFLQKLWPWLAGHSDPANGAGMAATVWPGRAFPELSVRSHWTLHPRQCTHWSQGSVPSASVAPPCPHRFPGSWLCPPPAVCPAQTAHPAHTCREAPHVFPALPQERFPPSRHGEQHMVPPACTWAPGDPVSHPGLHVYPFYLCDVTPLGTCQHWVMPDWSLRDGLICRASCPQVHCVGHRPQLPPRRG